MGVPLVIIHFILGFFMNKPSSYLWKPPLVHVCNCMLYTHI